MTSGDDELEAIRMRIADVDSRIVQAVAQRMRLSSRIGQIKSMRGMGIESKEVERIVLQRARDKAAELGLEQELVEKIFALLIDYSKRQQRKEVDDASHRHSGA
jgi:chorismate mutase